MGNRPEIIARLRKPHFLVAQLWLNYGTITAIFREITIIAL